MPFSTDMVCFWALSLFFFLDFSLIRSFSTLRWNSTSFSPHRNRAAQFLAVKEHNEALYFPSRSRNQATKLTGDKKTWEDREAEKETSGGCKQAAFLMCEKPFFFLVFFFRLVILNGVCVFIRTVLLCECARQRLDNKEWRSRWVGWEG